MTVQARVTRVARTPKPGPPLSVVRSWSEVDRVVWPATGEGVVVPEGPSVRVAVGVAEAADVPESDTVGVDVGVVVSVGVVVGVGVGVDVGVGVGVDGGDWSAPDSGALARWSLQSTLPTHASCGPLACPHQFRVASPSASA
jgi:hypothetical protein